MIQNGANNESEFQFRRRMSEINVLFLKTEKTPHFYFSKKMNTAKNVKQLYFELGTSYTNY